MATRDLQHIQFSIEIDAPRDAVWETMLEQHTYREWTRPFAEGSRYEGDWSEGSEIRFLGEPAESGTDGMLARIRISRRPEFVSIEHLGMVRDGVEDTTSSEVLAWAGAREEYTFVDHDGRTELRIDMNTSEEALTMMNDAWPLALQRLKELVEHQR